MHPYIFIDLSIIVIIFLIIVVRKEYQLYEDKLSRAKAGQDAALAELHEVQNIRHKKATQRKHLVQQEKEDSMRDRITRGLDMLDDAERKKGSDDKE